MENIRSLPIIIPNDSHVDEDSKDERCDEWQELEQFWGEEKCRISLQEESQLSSSLEEHLLHDDYLKEPDQSLQNDIVVECYKTVKGKDVKDIPTSYIINGFKLHELVVIGTYVDPNILPGFRYKVRKNLTKEYLFQGKPKYLESIGLGYGKRLTFEGDTLNENDNYFWSDSRVHGYGFTLQTIQTDDVFTIFDTKTSRNIGRIVVINQTLKEDTDLTTVVGDHGYIEKQVEVHFICDVIFNDSNGQNIFIDDVIVRGKAVFIRDSLSSKAKISQIFLDEFIQDSCLLLPDE